MKKLSLIFVIFLVIWIPNAQAEITLLLGTPEYFDCGRVTINGFISSDEGPVFDLIWDWGDGKGVSSFFPASHRYAANGTYTVHVTAASCSTKRETTTVNINNATDPGCPSVSDPDCFYLTPYNLHLSEGSVSTIPLSVEDQDGSKVSGSMTFSDYDPTLLSISIDGYVTALRQEASNEIGTWVKTTIDGLPVANTSVVRVLSQDYGTPFSEIMGENTILYYPTTVNGEDIASLVDFYQIPLVNEYAYTIQAELMGTRPFNGCRQVFEVDFGESEGQRVCGISGNPIRLGWNITGNLWQNCFLVPFIPPRSPQWFVFYHELGHNFTWASRIFANALGSYYYSEGIASAISLAVMDRIIDEPSQFPLGNDALNSLEFVYQSNSGLFLNAFNNWVDTGADFSTYNPDIVDGMWLYYENYRGEDFAVRFFMPLQSQYILDLGEILCEMNTLGEDGEHTFFAALISAAVGQDLSNDFINVYHFPLDQTLFDSAYTAFINIIEPCECDLSNDGSCNILDWPYFIEDWGRTDCGTPPGSGNPPNDCECDLNHDGSCNILDWPYFIEDWGRIDCPL